VSCENDAQTRPKVRELPARLGHPSYVSGVAVPDAELGVLALGGDVQALAALLEHCRPSLYTTAMGLLRDRADAFDAVHETCVVALTRFGDVRDVAAARGWLHRVVRNVCLMRLRQRREISLTEIEIHDTVPGPVQALEHHALRDWVWEALGRLTPEERVTVMLRHFARCTSREAIAQITAIPVGTVRSRLNRARSAGGCSADDNRGHAAETR
jgi:RNA polymerase sigma factor (sigma-70 family)